MISKKVSVIIPVYNGAKYISRCMDSILNQSYKSLEILVIDDNSEDISGEIVKKYLVANENIKYYRNKETLGPAETRNIGLQFANSEYILFLDCDDWIDLNCIEKAVKKIESEPNIDIVVWEIKTAYNYCKISSRYQYLYNNIISGKMAVNLLSHSFENEFFLSPLLGCKLFRKSLLDNKNIVFPNTLYEDDMFTYLTFLNARKVALITDSCLYYFQHQESITHHFSEKNIVGFFDTFKSLYSYINDSDKESYYKYLNKCLNSMIDTMLNNVSDLELQAKYKTMIFKLFYETININEYYNYAFSLTI